MIPALLLILAILMPPGLTDRPQTRALWRYDLTPDARLVYTAPGAPASFCGVATRYVGVVTMTYDLPCQAAHLPIPADTAQPYRAQYGDVITLSFDDGRSVFGLVGNGSPPFVATVDRGVLIAAGCSNAGQASGTLSEIVTAGGLVLGSGNPDPLRYTPPQPRDTGYVVRVGDVLHCRLGGAVVATATVRGAHQRILPVVSR